MGFAASWVQNVTAIIGGNRLARHLRARWQSYAVLAIFVLAALVWFYRSLDWCGSNTDGYSICGVDIDQAIYQLIYDFQNLITGLLALVAAYITTRPMRRQLAFMAMQSAVMTRGEIAQALSDVESRRREAKPHREKVSRLESQLYGDEGEPVPVSDQWAESAGAAARAFRRHVKQDRNELRDPSALNVKKRELEQALETLERCLARIRVHTPSDLHGEGLDADQISKIVEDQRADSKLAAGELPNHFSIVSSAMKTLWISYGQRIIELRALLRSIDDSIQRRAQIEADKL